MKYAGIKENFLMFNPPSRTASADEKEWFNSP
jgi:hypothetical protein